MDLSFTAIGSLAYASIIGTAGAFLLYFRILKAVGSGNLMLVTICIPPVSVTLGALVLGEQLSPGVFLGAALILTGLLIIDGRVITLLRRIAMKPGGV